MKEVKDNTKIFRKIVREHNARTGFTFTLPKDTDFKQNYAHPVFDDGQIKMRGQIDPTNTDIYGVEVTIDGVKTRLGDYTTYNQLQDSMVTKSFKYNLATLKLLTSLQDELDTAINEIRNKMFDLSLHDAEVEEHYDLALRTAREIRKTFIKEER